eukprot:15335456-Alexandrium_andersonii.AAC.1
MRAPLLCYRGCSYWAYAVLSYAAAGGRIIGAGPSLVNPHPLTPAAFKDALDEGKGVGEMEAEFYR